MRRRAAARAEHLRPSSTPETPTGPPPQQPEPEVGETAQLLQVRKIHTSLLPALVTASLIATRADPLALHNHFGHAFAHLCGMMLGSASAMGLHLLLGWHVQFCLVTLPSWMWYPLHSRNLSPSA